MRNQASHRRMLARLHFLLVGSAILTLGALDLGPVAQTPVRPQFKSGVDLLEIDAIATDDQGRPVTDLRLEEWRVLENGTQREIVFMDQVSLPFARRSVVRSFGVSTNAGAADARLFFLILDDARSLRNSTGAIQQTVRQLLERLAPHDQVAMLWVSQSRAGAWEFTTDHASILKAVDRFSAQRPRIQASGPLRDRFDPIAPRGPDETGFASVPVPDGSPDDLKHFFDSMRPLTIVADVSGHVAGLRGRRKAVVYIGEGLQALDPDGNGSPVAAVSYASIELQRALSAARRSNVAVYLLDPHRPRRVASEGLFEERVRPGQFPALAEATGGFSAASGLIDAQIDRIVLETSSYYLLGIYSPPRPPPGLSGRLRSAANTWDGFRRLDVTTTRPGVSVRARRGYFASTGEAVTPNQPPERADLSALAAAAGVIPRSDLALDVQATAYRGRSGKHPVAIAVRVSDAAFRGHGESAFVDTVGMGIVVVEPGRKVRLTRSLTATVSLGSQAGSVRAGGYVLCERLDLPPGRYQLRLGVESRAAGRTGSVYHDLVVPDFDRRPLSLTSIVLTRRAAAGGGGPVAMARTSTIAAFTPMPPLMTRELRSTDDVSAHVRMYRDRLRRQTEISMTARITGLESGTTAWETATVLPPDVDGESDHRITLPLAILVPGPYRLSLAIGSVSRPAGSDTQLIDFDIAAYR